MNSIRYAHVRDGCTCCTRRSPAPVREAGELLGAHPHAKLARTRTLMAADLLLRVVRPVGIGALVDCLRSVPRALARALLDSLNGTRETVFVFVVAIVILSNKPSLVN